jgi:hypothetical protein
LAPIVDLDVFINPKNQIGEKHDNLEGTNSGKQAAQRKIK